MNIEKIINFFCEIKGVSKNTLMGYDKNTSACYTRYMLWYYLHIEKGMSVGVLANKFHRNRPSVFRGIRILKTHMNIYEKIRCEYESIKQEWESVDNTTPSENME